MIEPGTYDLLQVNENGQIIDHLVREDIKDIALSVVPTAPSGASLIQGWDGLYAETDSGIQRVEANGGPNFVAYVLNSATPSIESDTVTDLLGRSISLEGKTELYLLSQDAEGNPAATGWVHRRTDVSSPWVVDTTNTAWDGTVLDSTNVAAWTTSLDSYRLSLRVKTSVNEDFIAPYTELAPNTGGGTFTLPYVSPPIDYLAATTNYVDIGYSSDLDRLTRIPLKPQVPNTYYQTVGVGDTPWTPSVTYAPGSTDISSNCPPCTVVHVVGGTQGAYEWTKLLGATTGSNSWKVSRGDTGLLDIGIWSRAKIDWSSQGSRVPVIPQFQCRFCETGMSVYVNINNMDTNSLTLAIPYWSYSGSGQNITNSSSSGNLARDLTIDILAKNSSGTIINNPSWSLSNADNSFGALTVTTSTNMDSLEIKLNAPMFNWPSVSVLDSLSTARPKY